MQELSHGAIKLGGNLLGLVAAGNYLSIHANRKVPDVQFRHGPARVGLQEAGKHANEGGLSCAIFTEHDHNLGVAECAALRI